MAANGWELTEKGLRKVLVFGTFTELTQFLKLVGPLADAVCHHPDLRVFRATHLEMLLITHDVDAVTAKDETLAEKIDELMKTSGIIPE